MKIESLVSDMMLMNSKARLWHWATGSAQHHTTFESFLTQNETMTDSFVESALGNDFPINLDTVGFSEFKAGVYKIEEAREEIKSYRLRISEAKINLEKNDHFGSSELVNVLDDVTELCSKTLYLLKLA